MRALLSPALLAWAGLAGAAEPAPANDHWAWLPVAGGSRERTIDQFVEARLEEAGLERSREADRRTLIRRLTFDLHGMPPRAEEVEGFVHDPDPGAYDRLVDRLLASPHYGERFARHWLDLAHYADTHGFERDRRRPHAWRYRDYVIDSFNADKPYDRFLQEQIAGDVLWPDAPEAVVATGFLAAGPWDFVGQVETQSPLLRRSARSLDLDDMATQVMTSTVAMTINCARCHDHKLDPIPREEYYQLRAVFAGVKRGDRPVPVPDRARLLDERKGVVEEIAALEIARDLADLVGGGNGAGSGTSLQGLDARTGAVISQARGFLTDLKPNSFAKVAHPLIDGVFVPEGRDGQAEIPVTSTGLTVTGIPGGAAQAWDAIRNGPLNGQHSPVLEGVDFSRGSDRLLGLHANAGITFDLAAIREAMGERRLRLTAQVGYFGQDKEDFFADAWILFDGRATVEFRQLRRADGLQLVDLDVPEDARFLTLMATDGGNGISMDQIAFGNPRLIGRRSLAATEERRLAALRDRLRELDSRLGELTDPQVYAVVGEASVPPIRILDRGDPESPVGEALPPRAPGVLGMLDPVLGDHETPEAERRAALARWITDPRNPLTARVIVNRLWHWHFGRGLVATPSDFGRGGGQPSHPELLDWLAAELVHRDWSLKEVHRLILNSATYKQESRFQPDAVGVQRDADNRLLWRQNARRIEAEAVRDAVLCVSGKLNLERGGAGFEDFEYKEAYAPEYTYITADEPALWRRSIYRYIVRTTPDRFLTTLDCPDPANFTPVRLASTTPLQALALYNNDFMLRQARYFAQRIESEVGPGCPAQVARGFELALGRPPSEDERELAVRFVQDEGLFAFCRALFNANEFVYVD